MRALEHLLKKRPAVQNRFGFTNFGQPPDGVFDQVGTDVVERQVSEELVPELRRLHRVLVGGELEGVLWVLPAPLVTLD